ncbi:MAG TPA: hypothetical protein VHD33_07335, partial [Legionellaceae bacterium]|nr:hypothetical protein [Legionellaceae bacterium]
MASTPPHNRTAYGVHSNTTSQKSNDLGLSAFEYKRYQQLDSASQSEIIMLLKERNRLNDYVKQYLEEEINLNKQFSILIQLLFPTESSLRYALQKVDEIEQNINAHLANGKILFDKNTTKKNRLAMLLTVAEQYQERLELHLQKSKKHGEKPDILDNLTQKIQNITILIKELNLQITTAEFHLHNKDILQIKDPDLLYFINKIKTIGVSGFSPRAQKESTTFFRISIFSAIYERFNPTSEQQDKTPDKIPHEK